MYVCDVCRKTSSVCHIQTLRRRPPTDDALPTRVLCMCARSHASTNEYSASKIETEEKRVAVHAYAAYMLRITNGACGVVMLRSPLDSFTFSGFALRCDSCPPVTICRQVDKWDYLNPYISQLNSIFAFEIFASLHRWCVVRRICSLLSSLECMSRGEHRRTNVSLSEKCVEDKQSSNTVDRIFPFAAAWGGHCVAVYERWRSEMCDAPFSVRCSHSQRVSHFLLSSSSSSSWFFVHGIVENPQRDAMQRRYCWHNGEYDFLLEACRLCAPAAAIETTADAVEREPSHCVSVCGDVE